MVIWVGLIRAHVDALQFILVRNWEWWFKYVFIAWTL